jgi:predicted nucleic acid-binding Zn ribbon protein
MMCRYFFLFYFSSPDKHATRAIEEASAHQSAEFALQRAAELQVYLNQLIHHPIACTSIVLRLFLALQDDLGTAWPECSTNALTRLANASVGAAVKVSESTANMQTDSSEDNSELLALQNYESSRIGAVLQAVPKLEGAVTLLREQAEEQLAVGMEFSRVAKEVAEAQPMDIASAGLLRSGRRSKRLGLEMSAALQSFSHHYKLCRYERMAFGDRRAAIARRHKERHRADQRASHMMHNQQFGLAQSAAMMDDMANDAGHECEEIGQRVKAEVHRVAQMRRAEWSASVKIVASAMKEALTERVAIWESVRENFFQTYPEFKPPAEPPVVDGPPQLQL